MHINNSSLIKKHKAINLAILIVLFFFVPSCKKFVEVNPPITQLTTNTVFNDDGAATSAVLGIYSRMMFSSGYAGGGNYGLYLLSGLSADEFVNYNPATEPYYTNSLDAHEPYLNTFLWSEPYNYIYTVNSILEGLSVSKGVTKRVATMLEAEAKFIRAFNYFNLVNEFGDVPYDTTTNYTLNNTSARTGSTIIYQHIIRDLRDALDLLSDGYIKADNTVFPVGSAERVRPNKWAAAALLARVYLYTGDWNNAAVLSTSVISNNATYKLEPNLNNVFLKNSSETIWQMMPVIPGFNTSEGRYLILNTIPTNVSLSLQLVNAFESGDQRKTNWIRSFSPASVQYYYPFKYQVKSGAVLSEYSMVLRLAEQYLIRAEARTMLGDIGGAQADLNMIRNRAGLANTAAADKSSLLAAIEHERRVELFSEWGHRWFDLKRTYRADAVLAPLKGVKWNSTDMLYPIPLIEIQNNPHITQNAGY